ncbi:hypothetical protein K4F52_002021 [Lecanicillium sp. MT-2017a]|nr:hypothetical protein K4F52_002021 [Lecanicillium sp. MT-2017a]
MARRRRPPRAGALAEMQPLRTAAQIAIIQSLYYVVALVLVLFTALVAGMPFSFNLILGWDMVRGDTTQGWLMSFIWIFDGGFCMAVAIVILIARSKLVPDFALTVHFLHLVATTLYTHSLPQHSMWWFCMIVSSALSVGLATWGCRYRELQPVFFGGRILGAGDGASAASTSRNEDLEAGIAQDGGAEEDVGHARGTRKGRGKDGQGEYEMMQMKSSS